MGTLTYNLLIRNPGSSTNYWIELQELAKTLGVEGPVLIAYKRRVIVMPIDLTDVSLNTKVREEGKLLSEIPQVVKNYEATIKQGTNIPRLMIVSPSLVTKVKKWLSDSYAMKGDKVFSVKVGEEYRNNGKQSDSQSTLPNAADVITTGRVVDTIKHIQVQDVGAYHFYPEEGTPMTQSTVGRKTADPLTESIARVVAEENEARAKRPTFEELMRRQPKPTLAALIRKASK